jgi:hypothetical protein
MLNMRVPSLDEHGRMMNQYPMGYIAIHQAKLIPRQPVAHIPLGMEALANEKRPLGAFFIDAAGTGCRLVIT